MIACKTFTFPDIAAYTKMLLDDRGSVVFDWMDTICKESPFVEFDLKAMYQNDQGQVVLTYFAMKSDKVNPFYEFRHLALQGVSLN